MLRYECHVRALEKKKPPIAMEQVPSNPAAFVDVVVLAVTPNMRFPGVRSLALSAFRFRCEGADRWTLHPVIQI